MSHITHSQFQDSIKQYFKAYDIRGMFDDKTGPEFFYALIIAFLTYTKAEHLVIGHDTRSNSLLFAESVAAACEQLNVTYTYLGICGSEEVYFACQDKHGIMITASHNAWHYNGAKLVKPGPIPLIDELSILHAEMQSLDYKPINFTLPAPTNKLLYLNYLKSHMYGATNEFTIKPCKIVAHTTGGAASNILTHFNNMSIDWIMLEHKLPEGPNPESKTCKEQMRTCILAEKADWGIALDGDFDRCIFFDKTGEIIDSYYVIGLLTDYYCQVEAHATIVSDAKLYWHTEAMLHNGGKLELCRVGHSFIKKRMREVNAIYAGESSGHHYFRSFNYCDSGMLTWILTLPLLQQQKEKWLQQAKHNFPISGEINFHVRSVQKCYDTLSYQYQYAIQDWQDGLSLTTNKWRCNIRSSNTEPVMRLNIETRGDGLLLEDVLQEISAYINIC